MTGNVTRRVGLQCLGLDRRFRGGSIAKYRRGQLWPKPNTVILTGNIQCEWLASSLIA